MSNCQHCGCKLYDDEKFCPKCGTPAKSEAGQTTFYQQPGYMPYYPQPIVYQIPPVYAPQPQIQVYQQPYPMPAPAQERLRPEVEEEEPVEEEVPEVIEEEEVVEEQPQLGMKWHKFLVCFGVIFSALLLIAAAVACFLGYQWVAIGTTAEEVVKQYPIYKWINYGFEAALLVCAIFAIASEICLARRKKAGPCLLYTWLLLAFLFVTAYNVAAIILLGYGLVLIIETAVTAVLALLFLILDIIYYKKRRYAFN